MWPMAAIQETRRPDEPPEEPLPLTTRELQVVELVVEGLRDAEIAARLAISSSTARAHAAAARGKLGARSRVQLAVFALRAGLVALNQRGTEDGL